MFLSSFHPRRPSVARKPRDIDAVLSTKLKCLSPRYEGDSLELPFPAIQNCYCREIANCQCNEGFRSSYEGWKLASPPGSWGFSRCFRSSYEGWKHSYRLPTIKQIPFQIFL